MAALAVLVDDPTSGRDMCAKTQAVERDVQGKKNSFWTEHLGESSAAQVGVIGAHSVLDPHVRGSMAFRRGALASSIFCWLCIPTVPNRTEALCVTKNGSCSMMYFMEGLSCRQI